MCIFSWLHDILARMLINGSTLFWKDSVGGVPWHSALGPVRYVFVTYLD